MTNDLPAVNHSSVPPLLLKIAKVLVILLAVTGIVLSVEKIAQKPSLQLPLTGVKKSGASISGKININGIIPSGALINLLAKEFGGSDFFTAESNLPATDGIAWSWNEAKPGTAYVLEAQLSISGSEIAKSEVLIAVAPAAGEDLVLNIISTGSTSAKISSISGSFDLNGYIPAGASLIVFAKKSGQEQAFSKLTDMLNPVEGAVWSWNNAEEGTAYDIQAFLKEKDGSTISQSQIITVSAPAHNEVLRINSEAKSPQSSFVSISGKIGFNGPVPGNGSISIAQRQSGQQQFSMFVTGLPVSDGVVWSFNQAKPGVTYDFQAYLITNGQTTAQSGILAVAAPATNEVLNLSVLAPPPAPPQNSISVDCLGTNTVNNVVNWQARISYNNSSAVKNAQQFHLIAGSSNGGNQLADITVNPKDPNHPEQGQSYTTGYVFVQGQTYYAQYAYSTCCGVFSNYSPTFQFSCNPFPTNTPAPASTSTPVPPTSAPIQPTNTPIPTNTPEPTPKIAQCNESCGGNGFQCVSGLDCLQEGGAIGGTLCRNSVCPDQTDCVCP